MRRWLRRLTPVGVPDGPTVGGDLVGEIDEDDVVPRPVDRQGRHDRR
jgi:hypothetical protein